MQLMVLANMKIIILCQRHSGILVSLDGGRRWRGSKSYIETNLTIQCHVASHQQLSLPGLGAQNLSHHQIGDSDPHHLYGGGKTHGCS